MKAPSIFIIVKCHGDGYGHNSYEYVTWRFSKREARERADELQKESGGFTNFDVEEVPSDDPMPERGEDW